MPRSSAYWKKRFEILQDALLNKADTYNLELSKQYEQAYRKIQNNIMLWYVRLMQNNDISLAMARQMLTEHELKEFKWTVEEYIKYGEENAINQKWMNELENASSRVHISKLEEIQLQIRHELETLASKQVTGTANLLNNTYADSYYQTAYEVQKGLDIGKNVNSLDTTSIEKVMSKPWTVDNKTFSDRIWSNKDQLVDTLHKELTQSIIRGDSPDKVIKTISDKMDVGKKQAGRVVMTEAAYISSVSRQDSFSDLGVEEYEVIATLDLKTSLICRALDGKIFKLSEYRAGVTAPPFHPYCRTTTAPYFQDMDDQRASRDPITGRTGTVGDMSYKEWHKKYVEGDPEAELKEKKLQNADDDLKQYEEYRIKLGVEYLPKTFDDFQDTKYTNPIEYGVLKAQIKGMNYYNMAVQNEPDITDQVKNIAKITGMDVLGLKFRIKGKDSYLRKIRTNYKPDGNEYEINDILRYTYGADEKSLSSKTLECIDKYSTLGYNTVKIKNSWLNTDNPYNGINTIIQAPNGQKFEMQYHTPESFELKNGKLHELYEKQRVITDEESEEFISLRDQMFDLSDKLTVPYGIERVK